MRAFKIWRQEKEQRIQTRFLQMFPLRKLFGLYGYYDFLLNPPTTLQPEMVRKLECVFRFRWGHPTSTVDILYPLGFSNSWLCFEISEACKEKKVGIPSFFDFLGLKIQGPSLLGQLESEAFPRWGVCNPATFQIEICNQIQGSQRPKNAKFIQIQHLQMRTFGSGIPTRQLD